MRKITLLLLTFYFSLFTYSQNLVPNPSFEENTYCPNFFGNFEVNYWQSYLTADYYNSCCTTGIVSVPFNFLGTQNASSLNAYCGLYSFTRTTTAPDYREFIGTQLVNPLILGQKYYVSLKVTLADSSNCATNNLGILFSTQSINFGYNPLIQTFNFAHINSSSIITEKEKWITIADTFIADSTYKYVYIGNFFDYFHTDTLLLYTSACNPYYCFDSTECNAYYYIDDICISNDSLECDVSSRIQLNKSSKLLNIYPNPANNILFISNNLQNVNIIKLKIYNSQGILEDVYYDFKDEYINIQKYEKGIYYLIIETKNEILNKKFIKL